MKQLLLKLCLFASVIALTSSFSSCSKPTPEGGSTTGEANTVSGIVKDAQGNPMAGVKVRAENPTGDNIHIDGTTDAQGKYKLKLSSIGGWKIYAWKEVTYNDKLYNLRMGMENDADYDAFATNDKAVVKNFVWKLSGRIPDRPASFENESGYFGATLRFINTSGVRASMPAGTKVTITLTPVAGAKYLDGTPATAPVVKTFTMESGTTHYYFGDVKVTNYHMTARSEYNGVTKTVYLGTYSDVREWLEFDFLPASGSGSYENGIKTSGDNPFYMAQE